MKKAPSECLESFVGKSLTLMIESVTVNGKDPGNLKVYKASYCAAVSSEGGATLNRAN